jgi:glycosyltransferase involved in cell wall biosynthesis
VTPRPLVSVMMPVHNAAPYLDASISSILDQTFTEFEFVILDDGSTDGSGDVVDAWARRDPRIRAIRSDRLLGTVGSSNAVAAGARGIYLARMDADDICDPTRLERQVAILAADEGAALVATLFDCIDPGGRRVRSRDRWRLVRRSPFSPFPHSSVMFPRRLFEAIGGYRPECVFWEDLDLYYRLGQRGRILVVPEALCSVRFHRGSTRLVNRERELEQALRYEMQCLDRFRATGRYGDAVTGPAPPSAAAPGPSRAEVLYSTAASRFWAGDPPGLWERLSPGDFAPLTRGGAGVFVFAVWGAWHHRSLRLAMQTLVRGRDLLARLWLDPRQPYEWRFQ